METLPARCWHNPRNASEVRLRACQSGRSGYFSFLTISRIAVTFRTFNAYDGDRQGGKGASPSQQRGVANYVVPESCVAHREVGREALTGVRAGQPLSRVRNSIRVPMPSDSQKATRMGALSQAPMRPGVVEDPGMHARSLYGNREISSLTVGASGGRRPASGR